MLAVFVVLILLMGIVNAANYVSADQALDRLLGILEENGGTFENFEKHGVHPENQQPQSEETTTEGEVPHNQGGKKEGMGPQSGIAGLLPGMSKETPYETRFFSVTLDNDTGELVSIDTARIAAVSQEEALEMATKAFNSGKNSSYIKRNDISYKYLASPGEGSTQYIFVDASRDMGPVRKFFHISMLVALGGFLGIALLVFILSPMMIRPIAESYEKQKKFITNAGHELKTPLSVIKSCNEVVEMESGSSKWTSAITEQVDRMSDLTNKLVSLAKMDEAQDNPSELQKEDLDFSRLVEDALEPFALMAEQKGLGFKTIIENPTIKIKGNTTSLTELINILADNAIKYCKEKGEIVFTLSQKGSKIILTEKNPADGLIKGSQAVLFDRFYQGEQSHNKEEAEGYGIGLSMAQSIVAAHGGTITADSPEDNELIITATF